MSGYQCPTCKSGSENPRNLVVFIDGTSNRPGPKKTNVRKLYNVTFDRNGKLEQHTCYFEGIGVHEVDHLPSWSYVERAIYSECEMALAWNMENNVKKAYRWLAERYQPGDRIYLFGFSRGAYQVRALAGVIHEVGLVKETTEKKIDLAYHHYHTIDPNIPKTRESAVEFKRDFCWSGVRIHFIGVWDTVSSLGLVKKDVHITASASVINACHFRHALALDERRVKFISEYFVEINAHHTSVQTPRSAISDVKEVWFAGCHSDVGGTSRPHTASFLPLVGDAYNQVHAGNVPLVWMGHEAAAEGLALKLEELAWNPEDIDFGREDSMKSGWKLLEHLPFRHQVSFCGTGKHSWRWHRFHPRLVIPHQHVHFSVLPGDAYTPRATLAYGIDLPMVLQESTRELWTIEPWSYDRLDENASTRLSTLLLGDQRKTLNFLGEVFALLSSNDKRTIQNLGWSEDLIRSQRGFDKFVLTLIRDLISDFSSPNTLLQDARSSLKDELSPPGQAYVPGVFYVVRFAARHEKLRQRFVADDEVIRGLVRALEHTAENTKENLFPLVMDSICCLIHDESKRDYVIGQLTAAAGRTKTGLIGLSWALESKAPSHLIASLKMFAILARYPLSFTVTIQLRSRILKLAKNERSRVGPAAVEALVALREPLPLNIPFSNILGYLTGVLPQLDVEVSGTSSDTALAPVPHVGDAGGRGAPSLSITSSPTLVPQANGRTSLPGLPFPLSHIFRTKDSGELGEKDVMMSKLLRAIESRDVHEHTVATLILLKLCREYPIVRNFCSKKVLGIFMRQLEQKKHSLLAAYALNTCLKLKMWKPVSITHVAKNIKTMVDKGWFDDAIGQVEGSEIFRELVTSGDLRQQVVNHDVVSALMKRIERDGHHEVRMSLICLDILAEGGPVDLESFIKASLAYLEYKDTKIQKKGARILAALAQMATGEKAIKPHLTEIVKMLLPSSDGSPPSRSQLFGPTAALYDLCRNETLREQIRSSPEFTEFKRLLHDLTLYPKTEAGIACPQQGAQ